MRVQLIHWNDAERRIRAQILEKAGYEAVLGPQSGPALSRQIREQPPLAFVIDLSRLLSQGRDVAVSIRRMRSTRHVPLIFVEGDSEKVTAIKKLLPDATYTTWNHIEKALKLALASPPVSPAIPTSNLAGYSGTPLPKKLGIKAGCTVCLINAPEGFQETLGQLPGNVNVHYRLKKDCDLVIWFNGSRRQLDQGIMRMGTALVRGSMWICWPKRASGVVTDLSEPIVRETGLAVGLVDYKVCAVDATWSGLLFTRRKK